MYNKKVWNTGERITADKLNNIEEGIYSNALVNKTQQVYINGLFNENKDGRLSVEGEGNDLKLEGSKEGLVTVDKIVGNTLVNLSPHYTLNCTLASDYDNFKPLLQNTYGSDSMSVGRVIQDIKPTTTYTVIYNIKQIPTEGVYLLNNPNINAIFSTHIQISSTDTLGIKCATLTSESDLTNKYVVLRSQNRNGRGVVEVEVIAILEGDYINKPIPSEAFGGLQSSFEENLVTEEMIEQGLESAENLGKYKVLVKLIGKNKVDVSKVTSGYITSIGQIVNNVSSNFKSDFIKISPNTNYIAKIHNGNWVVHGNYSWFDSNKVFIRRDTTNTYITSPSNAEYLIYHRATLNNVNIDDLLSIQCQIEEGTVSTDYEEYFERTTNVYLNSLLLEGDEIVMKDGELCHYHKGLIDIWTGDENWTIELTVDGGIYAKWSQTYDQGIDVQIGTNSLTTQMCDKLPIGNPYTDLNCVWIYKGAEKGNVERRLALDGTQTTIEEFVNWLKNNPLKVYYPLQNPYYEPIQSDKLLLECANDSTLHIESIVPVENISASYTGNVPSVYAIEETNQTQDDLIDISLCATDEMYMMIEPLLETIPTTTFSVRMVSKMVEMYVAMVERGLKTIDEVPLRYREQVKEILESKEEI